MKTLIARDAVYHFRTPKKSIGTLDADIAAKVIAAAADIALVIDKDGVIRDISVGNGDWPRRDYEPWIGQRWIDTVTVESRAKIEALLKDAGGEGAPRWRQVNHPIAGGPDIPVLYATVRVGSEGRVVALGRDLRTVAALQQRLVDAQQSMEREYARLRHAETRYRLLFQIASEAVLIVEGSSQRIIEANPAASELLGIPDKRMIGRSVRDLFMPAAAEAIDGLIATVRATGRAEDVEARLKDTTRDFSIAASLFRQDNASHILVRLQPLQPGGAITLPKAKSRLISVVEKLPDAFVVTDLDRRILTANTAFLDLAQLGTEVQAKGQPLDRWLGRSGVDLDVLTVNLREHGSVRHFSTVLRGEYGTTEDVEVSAVSVPEGETPCYGFTMRNVGRRSVIEFRPDRKIAPSVAHLTNLVGRVSLKDLVREATDVIERLCIEAALEQTRDNRASAAEMLGLSRQSLYAKLRRYGLGDLGPEDDEA